MKPCSDGQGHYCGQHPDEAAAFDEYIAASNEFLTRETVFFSEHARALMLHHQDQCAPLVIPAAGALRLEGVFSRFMDHVAVEEGESTAGDTSVGVVERSDGLRI